ncbi:carbon-nitrogen hydrolase family protein [Thermus thermamylovorans]|uniref:Carbon-nitrogen hydrolase family protein n=1 Tax=Thermus thermamylovorans TaxID=2509362 RepID=A0A4Q9B7K5_9DEIN|nr:carbon-nitrogen hydrolase family protein [Thermus thermamylovorans]TBH21811.1 carbon-nitrogen hydrolase family protein [Thermus thermamylovorans]
MRLALAHLAKRESLSALLQALVPLVHRARGEGALALLLPELILGKRGEEGLPQALEALAGENRLAVVAGFLAQGPRNRLGVFPQGPFYDKVHPFLAPGEEGEEGVEPGEGPVMWAFEGRRFGLALCYDLDFPELFRSYALMGAEVFLVGSAWPGAYGELLSVLARARAAENQAYLLLANRADTGSPSLAVAPDGRLLALRREEGLLVVDLDLGFLEEYRARYPILRHRRMGAYPLW